MDLHTILIAIALVLSVYSIAFLGAFPAMRNLPYWRTWTMGTLISTLSVVMAILTPSKDGHWHQPPIVFTTLLAFAFYRQAAREFNERPSSWKWLTLPIAVIAFAFLLSKLGQNSDLFPGICELVMAGIALSTAWEYHHQKQHKLISRRGLTASFSLMAVSMFILSLQHLFLNEHIGFPSEIPPELHFSAWLLAAVSNGAFTLTMSFERKLQEQHEALIRDPLTGAFNRREFMRRLENLLDDPKRPPYALLLVDLDHFKSINDRFGHVGGDEALLNCADLIQWHLREEDCFARIGGEEFAVLMRDISGPEAQKTAERIRRSVSQSPLQLSGQQVQLTFSAGLYLGHKEPLTPKQLLRTTDRELYRSKDLGRNRISCVSAA